MIMAKDSDGRKFNRIPEYDRVQNGKTIHVSAHVRSNVSVSAMLVDTRQKNIAQAFILERYFLLYARHEHCLTGASPE